MPKTKTGSGAKKRFRVSGAGKLLRRRRHRTAPPGHIIKSRPGKRKRARETASVASSDQKSVKKLLGRG
jgi:large subunit ribosomal protein L35